MDEYQKTIFDFIYVMAIRDAVMQNAYVGERKWMWDNSEDMQDVKSYIEDHLNLILTGEYLNQGEFDSDFYELTKKICNLINEKKQGSDFKFGNAQKLVNMMDKYFYITIFNDSAKRECFKYCHCPMDSIMIKTALSELRKNKEIKTKFKNRKLKSDTSWSKLKYESDDDMEKYRDFQNIVSELAKPNYYPIEYDYKNWQD